MGNQHPQQQDPRTHTTVHGSPVGDNQNSLTAGSRGPLAMQDVTLFEKLAHFNRERVPERVVHAKGGGAYGTLKVTKALSEHTCAKLWQRAGTECEAFVRFSTVAGESGFPDTVRDPRGFAMKFYTEDGNWDLVGNNTPVFFIRDGMKFPDFIHSQKREPRTGRQSDTIQWDFWSHSPESLHQVTWLMGDRGLPASWRHQDGFGSHTFSLWTEDGKRTYVKWHFKTDQGIEFFTDEQAGEHAVGDWDFHRTDLYEAIESGDFPTWTVKVQLMTEEEAATYKHNPFDLTKVWNYEDHPLIEVGTLELNRNPENYFAEVEQAAFHPGSLPPGFGASPDKMLQARLQSYADAHRYRIGINHAALPVNRPHAAEEQAYHARDGHLRFDGNHGGAPNYEPNSFGGPAEDTRAVEPPLRLSGEALARYDRYASEGQDDYEQAGDLFRVMGRVEGSQERLFQNIATGLGEAPREIQLRWVQQAHRADPDYARGVLEALGIPESGFVPESAAVPAD